MVTNVPTEFPARTRALVVQPDPIAPGPSVDMGPLRGIKRLEGSTDAVLSLWSFGTLAPPMVTCCRPHCTDPPLPRHDGARKQTTSSFGYPYATKALPIRAHTLHSRATIRCYIRRCSYAPYRQHSSSQSGLLRGRYGVQLFGLEPMGGARAFVCDRSAVPTLSD